MRTAVGLLCRRGAQCAPISRHIRSSQITYCYTCGLLSAGATQGELPKGQERVLWRMTVPRNSFTRYYRQFLRISFINQPYRRVRRPRRTVSNGWYNLSRRGEQCSPTPRQITRYENRLHLIKNGEQKTLTVILHSPFSILNFSRCLETHSANKAHASESSPTKTL